MVQNNLIIFLALLWITPPLIAKRSVMPKFQKMSKISYREEVDKVAHTHVHRLDAPHMQRWCN